eukprot:TRINITY_DN5835_c0_g1_i3.p1 TRINITY_DN5835_c0_g1~~TRINITY_DN5835_c0_g1_i3.p1  ORF type:complete len:101 (+),score=18.45 TRINITY_DN5835_c0_g1_i3:137-439(+)
MCIRDRYQRRVRATTTSQVIALMLPAWPWRRSTASLLLRRILCAISGLAGRAALMDLKICFEHKNNAFITVSYTHLRAHETPEHLVCRLLLEKKKKTYVI